MGAASSAPVLGVDISPSHTSSCWWAGIALGGKLYGVPCNADQLLIYDVAATEPIRYVDTRKVATGEGKWRSSVALGGKLYGIPDRAEALLIYDFSSGTVSGVDTRKVSRGPFKWQAAVALAGKVYGIPHHASKLLVHDPKTRAVVGVDTTHIATGNSKWLAGMSLGAKVVGVPCNADALLIYDPLTGHCVGVPTAYHATGPFKWLSAVTFQGLLYAIPCHAECILVFDPSKNQVSHVDTSSIATGPGKWVAAVACAGKIYGIPDHATSVLVFDPKSQEVSGIDISHLTATDTKGKWQSATVLGGKIYAVPYNAHEILVVDPSASRASVVDVRSLEKGSGKWGFAAAIGGKLCGLPWDATHLLVHEPQEAGEETPAPQNSEVPISAAEAEAADPTEIGFDGAADISPNLGELLVQDFVGAWLSEWIYFTDETKKSTVPVMKVGGVPVKFQVHSVMDDPLQGSPARSAVVTAVLPDSAVVYLVFKGSSFMNDFVVNASVGPDYTPFDATFDDRTTFIHHGAHHAIAQLRVQQWPALKEQLERCAQDGVKQLVITGHSLGGQYALAFMLQVFLDGVREAPMHTLLRQARSVAFGAPMCYGAAEGFEVRQDLAEFIQERTVVYVNSGDPAPRLWSELDLEDFMRYAVSWLQQQVSSFSMRILDYASGGLAQKAQEILKRPDIEKHLLRPAARYVHLSQIRVLAKDFLLWRPLSYGRMNIDDHSLSLGYMPALCAAFDPVAAGGLWDENGQPLVDEAGHGLI
ncbi:unnamed protein product [Effrenium voratum]|uniref:Fungal lipase-type domain-containing protein n=1 Tax=Effrenium voratum TaxID=2562239 RepID=A0AA36JF32_9DINO|nr:unnamed protein product [Effrenium voratum]CAJ1405033.1 unnamed protein product [Effrenium voratum]CAJ1448367.1 unnamed protein product [Effrenium voratum]CAJ1451896.1 unnamed protein product [Effrenium voratum]